MKKLTATLLALTLCGSLLAGCGANDKQDPEKDQPTTPPTSDESIAPDMNVEDDANTESMPSGETTDKPAEIPETETGNTQTPPSSKPTGGSSTSGSTSGSNGSSGSTTAPTPKPESKPEPAKPTASQAQAYVGQAASSLKSALGAPSSSSYSPSCMGEGEDGIWTYDGFTVYTYRENGTETVEAVQ